MKKLFIRIACISAAAGILLATGSGTAPSAVAAERRSTGIGIVLGEPTGFTGKHWIAANRALDLGLAFSLNDFFLISGDYAHHFGAVFAKKEPFLAQLNPYIGIGGVLWLSTRSRRTDRALFTSGGSSVGLGLRIPLGIEWLHTTVPIGVFAELAPGIGIIPSTFAFLQGGIGARYYF